LAPEFPGGRGSVPKFPDILQNLTTALARIQNANAQGSNVDLPSVLDNANLNMKKKVDEAELPKREHKLLSTK
jgi:hypothetical protein